MNILVLLGLCCVAQCYRLESKGYATIVDGEEANEGEFPFIISLTKSYGGIYTSFFCGGSILTENIIITAGHCLVDERRNPGKVVVFAGHHNRSDTVKGVQKIALKKVVVHPYYNHTPYPFNIENDISLGLLSKAFDLNDRVQTIKIPSSADSLFDGQGATTAGWGYRRTGGQPQILHKIALRVLTNSQCQSNFGRFPVIRQSEICANRTTYGGTCSGDSGGPLLVKGSDDKHLLVGLTSWGRSCTEAEYPSVFARVTSHLNWINKTAAALEGSSFKEPNNEDVFKFLFDVNDLP